MFIITRHIKTPFRFYDKTLCSFYHKNIIDHYENPRNVGSFNSTDKNIGTGLVGSPACGDVMKLQIKINKFGKIIDSKFKTFGCGSAIASSSLVTEYVIGKNIDKKLVYAVIMTFNIFCTFFFECFYLVLCVATVSRFPTCRLHLIYHRQFYPKYQTKHSFYFAIFAI